MNTPQIRISQLTNLKGKPVNNHYVIEWNNATYLKSYNAIIAKVDSDGKIFLDEYYWNYSVTTSKYRNQFLDSNTAEIKKAINKKAIELINLNNGEITG